MLRSLTAALAMTIGCAAPAVDDLAGEPANDGADGKADAAADGVYTYFSLTADLRKCAAPVCGGYFVQRLNRTTTTCANGASRASCYSPTLDWSESGLSPALQGKLVDAANADALADG